MSTEYSSAGSENNGLQPGYGSVRALGGGFAAGSFTRPTQLNPAMLEQVAGGVDPETVSEMSHVTAEALLDRVHHSADPQVVERTVNLVQTEGLDLIAELWAREDADTLPGALWRLYMLREWMRDGKNELARLWRTGEPDAAAASAVTGIDEAPAPEDIARTADSILAGAFTGDFAVALERSSAFCTVIAAALGADNADSAGSADSEQGRRLSDTARDFREEARLWRRGQLY